MLNSLESFTQQTKKRTMSDELVQLDRQPNFHMSPLSAYLSATPTSNDSGGTNRQLTTPASFCHSPPSSLSRPTVYPLPPSATNIPSVKDTPDLVQNLPRTQITPPNSESSSPDGSDMNDNENIPLPVHPATSTPQSQDTRRISNASSETSDSKRDSMLAEPESSSILGSNLDLSGSFADCFAEEKRTTLRRVPTPPTSGSVKLAGGESHRSSLASFALVGTSCSNDSANESQNESAETVVAAIEPRPVVMRAKPPVPKKPQPYGATDCQMSTSVRSWSREPVEILKM